MLIHNPHIINLIVNSIYHADYLTRANLINGVIVKEDDYTSNFTQMIRKLILSKAIPGLTAHSQVLPPTLEKKYGCDACIIIASDNNFKIGLFEAKWPRLLKKSGSYDWDKNSRFSGQLQRQNKLRTEVAKWEMFYCEYDYLSQPANFPNFVSACAKHKHAFNHDKTKINKKWKNQDLNTLLNAHLTTIDAIIREMCICSFGKPLTGDWKDYIKDLDELKPKHILIIEHNTNAQ